MPFTGELDDIITIKRGVESVSGSGGKFVDWDAATTIATPWAKVQPLRGREQLDLGIAAAEVDYRIWIRYRPDVRASDRIFWRSRELDIVSATNFRNGFEWMEIMAKERLVGTS